MENKDNLDITTEINGKTFDLSKEDERKQLKKVLFSKEGKNLDKAIIQEALLKYIDFYLLDEKKYKNINERFYKIKKLLKKSVFSDKTDKIMEIIKSKKEEVTKETDNKGKKTVKKFSFKTIQDINEELTKEEDYVFEEYGRKIREKRWKEKTKGYIEEELEKNKANAKQFNSENIKVTKSTISFVTDLHADNSSLSISLKQTGFIKSFNGESTVYDVKNKRFLSKEEFENLKQNNNVSYEDFIRQFVIIPDFEIPDDIPEGFFVNGGDMNDRGSEGAKNYVMMIRVRQKYGEKLRNLGYSEDEIKQKLNEKFPMALGDHELYYTSLFNEEKNIENRAEKKALEELKKYHPNKDENYLKKEYEKEFEEYKAKYYNIYKIEFEKTHEIIKNMREEGAITFGGSVGDTNTFYFHSCPDANSVALLIMAAIFPYNKELFDKIDPNIDKDVIENLQNKLKGNIKNKEIFDKIKVNLFKSVLRKDVKASDITDEDLKELCEKFWEQNKDESLNNNFTNFCKYVGIPTNKQEYNDKRSLKAKECLEVYSYIGSNLGSQINGNDNPLLTLTTFKDSFTNRGEGFLDSENLDGNGVSSAPIYGITEENLKIVFGHTFTKAIKNIFDKTQISKIYEETTGKKITRDELIKINGGLRRFNKKKTDEEIENQALDDLKYDIKSEIRKEKNLNFYNKISTEEIEEKLKSKENRDKLEEKIKKMKEEQNFYLKIREKTTKEKFDEFCLRNGVIPNDNNVSNGYNKPSETSVVQIDKSGHITVNRYKKTKKNTVELLESRELTIYAKEDIKEKILNEEDFLENIKNIANNFEDIVKTKTETEAKTETEIETEAETRTRTEIQIY